MRKMLLARSCTSSRLKLDLISPLSGEILEVNGSVADAPELINAKPYESGWLVRIRMSDPTEIDALLDAKTYEAWVADQ
jgi:glycine cleavage system H protein